MIAWSFKWINYYYLLIATYKLNFISVGLWFSSVITDTLFFLFKASFLDDLLRLHVDYVSVRQYCRCRQKQ